MSDVTRILSAIDQGDPKAAAELLPLVYDELRKLAAAKLGQERPGQTLQATTLVHEAYVRLVDVDRPQNWNGRGHFFAAAAEAMRRILVDQARRKLSLRRGGDMQRRPIENQDIEAPEPSVDLLAVHEALERFQGVDASAAQIVTLRYFAGLTIPQVAEALGISTSSADRSWAYARAWLRSLVASDRGGTSSGGVGSSTAGTSTSTTAKMAEIRARGVNRRVVFRLTQTTRPRVNSARLSEFEECYTRAPERDSESMHFRETLVIAFDATPCPSPAWSLSLISISQIR